MIGNKNTKLRIKLKIKNYADKKEIQQIQKRFIKRQKWIYAKWKKGVYIKINRDLYKVKKKKKNSFIQRQKEFIQWQIEI